MIGSSVQQDSRVRSNTARFLALFLALSVVLHGLYYPREWLLFGFVISAYVCCTLFGRTVIGTESYFALGRTDALILGMLLFSVLGVFHPVRVKDGLLEALHWGIFWVVYRLGMLISTDEIARKKLLHYIEWLAMVIAILGWLPRVSQVGGRFSSVFGYPNSMAAFLGAALLLLNPRRKLVGLLLFISLLATGSRAGVGLFVVVFIGQQFIVWSKHPKNSILKSNRLVIRKSKVISGTGRYFYGGALILLGISGLVLIMLNSRPALDNLATWNFSSSSWLERVSYYKDGFWLAWNAGGVPQAGGWWAFPTVQRFPYWTADPHSSFIHILLNQGVFGIINVGIWGCITIAYAWRAEREKRSLDRTVSRFQETQARFQVWTALLFLVLHSLVDADFAFGSLGCLFWLLFGSIQKVDSYPLSYYAKKRIELNLNTKVTLVLSALLCLICASLLLNPTLIEKERNWNAQAVLWSERDGEKSTAFWNKSLNWDQTQNSIRQKQAEYLLHQGNLVEGLEAVEEVLKWQPYNIGAYEWAQSVVWDAAEKERLRGPEMANTLYRWIEGVPSRINERVKNLNSTESILWHGQKEFLPTPHILLLADYARQRQLTQLLSKT